MYFSHIHTYLYALVQTRVQHTNKWNFSLYVPRDYHHTPYTTFIHFTCHHQPLADHLFLFCFCFKMLLIDSSTVMNSISLYWLVSGISIECTTHIRSVNRYIVLTFRNQLFRKWSHRICRRPILTFCEHAPLTGRIVLPFANGIK